MPNRPTLSTQELPSTYRGKVALVTGGLGFIGSNLARALVAVGATVLVVDSGEPACGANPHNLQGIAAQVFHCDIGDEPQVAPLLRQADLVFNLAGEISHAHSMRDPERDLRLNALAQLRFVEACVRHRPGVRVVYGGTRQVYGVAQQLPVDESHPIAPVDYNGVHKFAATSYHLLQSRLGALDAVVLRLSNVYGPRMALNVPGQGFLGVYLRRALLGEPLEVWGDGSALRDPVYIDDVVRALLLAGARPRYEQRVYNLGGPAGLTLNEIAQVIAKASQAPILQRSFPALSARIDIGSYVTNNGRIARELGWHPQVSFSEGVAETLSFYRTQRLSYLPPGNHDASASERAS